FNEPRVGTYECLIQGSVGEDIALQLTPNLRAVSLGVGPVNVTVRPKADGSLTGQWKSIQGRGGNFVARRRMSSPPPLASATPSNKPISTRVVSSAMSEPPPASVWVPKWEGS